MTETNTKKKPKAPNTAYNSRYEIDMNSLARLVLLNFWNCDIVCDIWPEEIENIKENTVHNEKTTEIDSKSGAFR